MPNTDDFRAALAAFIQRATKQGRPHVEVNAGELHRLVGGYPAKPGQSHSMPSCCQAMREELKRGSAQIVFETESGSAPALTVCYLLPRPQ